ncbi:MAG: oxidoreductase [Chitinophagaceae bacterium]
MKPVSIILILTIFFSPCCLFAQKKMMPMPVVEVLTKDVKTNIRGLSAVNDNVVWVSGSNGTVGVSTDGGKSWKWKVVKGFEKTDFRDIEAFDGATAVIMAVGEPAYILKTNDGGSTWKVVYENKAKGMFLDAMEFWNEQAGIVIGDPTNGKFFIARTFSGGDSWKEIPDNFKPKADSGEACFAASGTNIRVLDRDEAIFVSGGKRSRVFIRDAAIDLPIVQGKESTGANSIAVLDQSPLKGGNQMIVVGGDFSNDTSSANNCFFSSNRGKTWSPPKSGPHGYKSCVEYLNKKELVTCGTTSVDYSADRGNTWTLISVEGFHVCRKAKNGTAVFFAGPNGKVGILKYYGKEMKH